MISARWKPFAEREDSKPEVLRAPESANLSTKCDSGLWVCKGSPPLPGLGGPGVNSLAPGPAGHLLTNVANDMPPEALGLNPGREPLLTRQERLGWGVLRLKSGKVSLLISLPVAESLNMTPCASTRGSSWCGLPGPVDDDGIY